MTGIRTGEGAISRDDMISGSLRALSSSAVVARKANSDKLRARLEGVQPEAWSGPQKVKPGAHKRKRTQLEPVGPEQAIEDRLVAERFAVEMEAYVRIPITEILPLILGSVWKRPATTSCRLQTWQRPWEC